MVRILRSALVATLAISACTSCFLTAPFTREPEVQPVQGNQQAQRKLQSQEPPKPQVPVVEANAYYETGAASTSFFVTRPESERTDRLPDKILRRGTVVRVLVPKAGAGWSRVRLADAQTGYVPLDDIDVVAADVRPPGFPTSGSGIDTGGNLELPEPPSNLPPLPSAENDTITIDSINLETPRPSPLSPDPDPSPDSISLDDLPEL